MARRSRRRARFGDDEGLLVREAPVRRSVRPLVLAGVGLIGAGLLYAAFSGGVLTKLPTVPGIDPAYVKLAAKWAKARGLPLQWVLATILAESGGNPNLVGDYHVDPKGASIGLMQVNTKAHAAELAAAGLTRESMFDPDKNIEWGTKILRACYDRVHTALQHQWSATPPDVLTRLCYTGALKSGVTIPDSAAVSVASWQRQMAKTSAAA